MKNTVLSDLCTLNTLINNSFPLFLFKKDIFSFTPKDLIFFASNIVVLSAPDEDYFRNLRTKCDIDVFITTKKISFLRTQHILSYTIV